MEQILIILSLTYGCELIIHLTGLPLPGSVVGMVLLFLLLQFKILKLDHINDGGGILLKHLGIMFVPLGVGIYQYMDVISDNILPLAGTLVVTTILVMMASGMTVQGLIRKGKKNVVR